MNPTNKPILIGLLDYSIKYSCGWPLIILKLNSKIRQSFVRKRLKTGSDESN